MAPVADEPSPGCAASWPAPPLSEIPPLKTPDYWLGADLEKDTGKWAIPLSSEIIAELDASINAFLDSGVTLPHLTKESFKLGPKTAELFARIREQLFRGIGFVLLKDLPVERWSREEVAAGTLGIGVHLGNLMIQNKKGHLLGHVKDLGRDPNDPTVRFYATHERQRFHTDGRLDSGLTRSFGFVADPFCAHRVRHCRSCLPGDFHQGRRVALGLGTRRV
jgi:hypothetical protein